MIGKGKKSQNNSSAAAAVYGNSPGNPNSSDEKQGTLYAEDILFQHSGKINKLISSNIQEFISVISPEGRIMYANPFFYTLGCLPDEIINNNFIDHIHPDDGRIIDQLLTDCFLNQTGQSGFLETGRRVRFRIMTVSGGWVETEGNACFLEDGVNSPGILFITRPVTGDRQSAGDIKEWTDTFDTFVIKFDINGFILFCNSSLLKLGGVSEPDIYGKYFPDTKFFSHSDAERKKIIKCLSNSKAFLSNRIECTLLGAGKKPVPVIFNCQPVIDKNGCIKYLTGEGKTIIEEIELRNRLLDSNMNLEKKILERTKEIMKINTELKEDIELLKIADEEIARLAAFPRESPHPILSSDYEGNIIYSNPATLQILEGLGLDLPEDILPKNHTELIKSCLNDKKSYHNLESKVKGHFFSWTYTPAPGSKAVHLHGFNISDQKYFEEKLLHESLHDKLTGLPNRSLFYDELARSIKIAQRRDDFHFAVLFLDMGRFKLINDSLGHLIGDKVLVEVANRLSSCLRPEDTAARFGGDEFIILLNNISDKNDPARVAERIQKKLSLPLNIENHEIFPSASIGITLSADEYKNPEEILRDANTAMYKAKAEGLSRYKIFKKSMHKQAVKLMELENSLQNALERGEFRIYYQPIVFLGSMKIAGFEALIRWQHPKSGLVMPENFIHTIEETGQIIPIGEWVIREACAQLGAWHRKYPDKRNLFISVNLSARQFAQPDLIEKISRIFYDENLSPGHLHLEITESIIMSSHIRINKMLRELREMDVRIGIDDFGMGYSSLSSLHQFPIQTLKIDRSFIAGMNNNDWTLVIPQTIISLGKNMQMDVIAEGVEKIEQLNQLKKFGCGYAQGYFFSPPVDSRNAEQLIRNDPEWSCAGPDF